MHALVSYLLTVILVVAFILYRIGGGGMPGGIYDLIKVLVAMDRCCFHLLLILHNFFLSSASCPAQTVVHQAFEPGSRSTHHDPEHE